MTQSDFTAFYPQFASFTPAVVLREYIAQANGRFSDFDESDAEEARRLYVAHKLTMYAFTVPVSGSGSADAAVLAAAGRAATREVSSKKVGEVSVSYSESSALSGTASSPPWRTWLKPPTACSSCHCSGHIPAAGISHDLRHPVRHATENARQASPCRAFVRPRSPYLSVTEKKK